MKGLDFMKHGVKDEQWVFSESVDAVEAEKGILRKILAYCDDVMCVENTFEKGAVGPMHHHPHTQITYVANGVFAFTIGEETRTVRKGDCMLKMHGVEHSCTCLEPGVLVDIFTPLREDFLTD